MQAHHDERNDLSVIRLAGDAGCQLPFQGSLPLRRDGDTMNGAWRQSACGETVLLALGPDTALILAERDDCFVTVNVMAGTGTAPRMTAEELQSLGDSIDFSVL